MISDEYAAGFFDGEGSVYAAHRKSSGAAVGKVPTIIVCIGNTNLEVLKAHQSRWGGSICARGGKHRERVKSGRLQQQYQWVLAARKSEPFLRAIFSHLIIKRDVVASALEYIDLQKAPRRERVDYSNVVQRNGRGRVAPITRPEYAARLRDIHERIRGLNCKTAPFNPVRQYHDKEIAI